MFAVVTRKYRFRTTRKRLRSALTYEEAESIVSRVAAKGEKRAVVPPHGYEFPELIDAAADIHRAAADCGAPDA